MGLGWEEAGQAGEQINGIVAACPYGVWALFPQLYLSGGIFLLQA